MVEEAESWLSPVFQPAYTQLVGVNLFGRLNTVDGNGNGAKATNKVTCCEDTRLQISNYLTMKTRAY